MMYGFSEEYLLDEKTLDEVLVYYDNGMDFETLKAEILIAKLGEALSGKKSKRKTKPGPIGDKPDIKTFEKLYGNKIKRPKK